MTLFEPPEPSPPPDPAVRVRLTVAYDGSGFHGFAAQPRVRTVGGTLAGALERVLRHPVELTCAGRTDTGVHAWGQVVSFDAAEDGLDLAAMQRSLNTMCGPAIVVRSAEVAATDFDARFSAEARRYRYAVLNREVADPFRATTAWHVADPLDLSLLRLGCDPLIGEHDFSSFCRRPRPGPSASQEPVSLVRRVLDARWKGPDADGMLYFWIEANAFCHQMVRSIVGLLVDAGLGRRAPGDISGALRARTRSAVGQLAPARGLCLWSVRYPSTNGRGKETFPRPPPPIGEEPASGRH